MPDLENHRFDEYRDLLELWAAWWNSNGRRNYTGNIVPPLTRTSEALRCSLCAGEDLAGARCEGCGRKGGPHA